MVQYKTTENGMKCCIYLMYKLCCNNIILLSNALLQLLHANTSRKIKIMIRTTLDTSISTPLHAIDADELEIMPCMVLTRLDKIKKVKPCFYGSNSDFSFACWNS